MYENSPKAFPKISLMGFENSQPGTVRLCQGTRIHWASLSFALHTKAVGAVSFPRRKLCYQEMVLGITPKIPAHGGFSQDWQLPVQGCCAHAAPTLRAEAASVPAWGPATASPVPRAGLWENTVITRARTAQFCKLLFFLLHFLHLYWIAELWIFKRKMC